MAPVANFTSATSRRKPGSEISRRSFVPWFWSDEYRRDVPADFALTDEEQEYSRLHGLQTEQLAWRRAKIDELRDPRLFAQEYPSTAAEAFHFSGHD